MDSVSVRLIEKPTDAQIETAVALCQKAFKGDISVTAMLGGNHDLEPGLFRSMLRGCAVDGSFYVVSDEKDPNKIYSVGAWFGPGKMMFSTEEQRAAGWNEFFGTLSTDTQDWWVKTFLATHEGELHKHLGENYLDGWFANIIATDPEYQRRGYATAMVNTVFARADKEGRAVSLATQSRENADWYQRIGFKLVGELEIPAETGAWPDYLLTRSKS